MKPPPLDCLCAGIVVADHVCDPVDRVPGPGELVLASGAELSIGGCASNVAVDLARLDRSAAVVGRVGRDLLGQFCRQALEQAGVDCEFLDRSETGKTSSTLVINTRGEDRRFIHSVGANAEFDGTEMTPELIRRSRVLYLGGYCLSETLSPENVSAAFGEARRNGVTTVLDVVVPPGTDAWPLLEPVLPMTDVFLPNDDEARSITGLADPTEQAREFSRAGARTAVVTCGEGGAVGVSERRQRRAGCYPVDFVDGTGSGDAFAAGYMYGLLRGADFAGCLRYGTALGASSVRAAGATTGVFTAGELEDFVASHELEIREW